MSRLLVVEDNRDLGDLIRLQLECAGHQVSVVSDAEQALLRLGDLRPQALIVDITLPGMDGPALCRRLRQDDGAPVIPVLLYSGVAADDARIRAALELPEVRFHSKGGSARTLNAAVDSLLGLTAGSAISGGN